MMKPVSPKSSSVGRPNPKAMRELLDFLWQARQELAARKAAAAQEQAKNKGKSSTDSKSN